MNEGFQIGHQPPLNCDSEATIPPSKPSTATLTIEKCMGFPSFRNSVHLSFYPYVLFTASSPSCLPVFDISVIITIVLGVHSSTWVYVKLNLTSNVIQVPSMHGALQEQLQTPCEVPYLGESNHRPTRNQCQAQHFELNQHIYGQKIIMLQWNNVNIRRSNNNRSHCEAPSLLPFFKGWSEPVKSQ